MAPASSKVLIIEDDRKMSDALVSGIRSAGYEVLAASSAEEGFFMVHNGQPDLLLLDLTLPHRNGLDVLRQIRKEGLDLRVLILTRTTPSMTASRVRSGADDYLGKPFSFPELLARMSALLFAAISHHVHSSATLPSTHKSCAPSPRRHTADLAPREFDLLLYLAENRGRSSPARCSPRTSGERSPASLPSIM